MRKTNVTRWCAMMIALLLILGSLAAPVRAAAINERTRAPIVVTGLEPGSTVKVYKIVDVHINAGVPVDPMYTWNSKVADYIAANYGQYTTPGTNAVPEAFFHLNGGERAAFLNNLWNENQTLFVDPNKPDEEATADDNGTATVRPSMGYYLIRVEGGSDYLLMTGSVFPKYENGTWVAVGSTASAKQEASSDLTLTTDGTSVTVGELVNYTLTLKAPRYPDDATQTGLCISVKLPEQMALNTGSVQVTGLLQGTESALSGYTVETSTPTRPVGSNQGLSFAVTCPDHTGYLGKDTIQVTFSATAGTTIRDGAAMTATAYLDYHANGYENTWSETTASVTSHTYGMELSLTDPSGTALSGGTFKLSRGTADLPFVKDGNVYRPALSGETAAVLTTDVNGKIRLTGLDLGAYGVTQTNVPAGYPQQTATAEVTLTDRNADGVLDGGNASYYALHLTNKPSSGMLPATGGMGVALFAAAGVVLTGTGLRLLRKKK